MTERQPARAADGAVVFDRPDVVASYVGRGRLSPAEEALFSRWVAPGSRIVDLGVGVGRTTPWLAARGSTYVGIDVAPNMVAAARAAHPTVDLRVGDAADLGDLGDASADVVVFSYNGIDYLPEGDRQRCLAECHRVLTDTGVLLFSTHNPRALVASTPPGTGAIGGLARAVVGTAARTALLARTPAFRRGEGWVVDRVQGGLRTHMAVPSSVVAELARHGLTAIDQQHGDLPRAASRWRTPWWYYVARRTTARSR